MHFFSKFLNIMSIFALVGGISLSISRSFTVASLTQGGTTLIDISTYSSIQKLHSAATVMTPNYQSAEAGVQLIIGILLILLGFFLHAFARMQKGERPVHITIKPKKNRQMWYWVDMRI